MSDLEGPIAEEIYEGLSDLFLDGTLHQTKKTGGGAFSAGSQSTTPTPIKGIIEEYSLFVRTQLGIPANDVKIIILRKRLDEASIAPAVGDAVTLRGTRYRLLEAATDPAHATWTFRGQPDGTRG